MTVEIPPATFNRPRAIVAGALAGAVFALGITAWVSGRFALGSVALVEEVPTFTISTGAAYTAVIVFAALASLLVASVTYAQRRTVEPEAARFPIRYIMPMAAGAAVVIAYAIFRIGIELAGDVAGGFIAIGVAEMTLIVLLAGLIAGGMTTAVVDTLARPAFISVEPDDIPQSGGEMVGEMMRAVGTPILGIVGAALFAIVLSQLLLAIEGAAAVGVFAVVAALILGGAALVAARPWDRNQPPTE
jgi:hypothetical protein